MPSCEAINETNKLLNILIYYHVLVHHINVVIIVVVMVNVVVIIVIHRINDLNMIQNQILYVIDMKSRKT